MHVSLQCVRCCWPCGAAIWSVVVWHSCCGCVLLVACLSFASLHIFAKLFKTQRLHDMCSRFGIWLCRAYELCMHMHSLWGRVLVWMVWLQFLAQPQAMCLVCILFS